MIKNVLLCLVSCCAVLHCHGQSYQKFIPRFIQQYHKDANIRPCDSLTYISTIENFALGDKKFWDKWFTMSPSDIRDSFFDSLMSPIMAYSYAYGKDKATLYTNSCDEINLAAVENCCFFTRSIAQRKRKFATLQTGSQSSLMSDVLDYILLHPEIDYLFDIQNIRGWDYDVFWGISGDTIHAILYNHDTQSFRSYEADDYLQNIAGDDVLLLLPSGKNIFRFSPYHYIAHIDQFAKLPLIKTSKTVSIEEIENFDFACHDFSSLDSLCTNDESVLKEFLIHSLSPNDIYGFLSGSSEIRYYGTITYSEVAKDHLIYVRSSENSEQLYALRETNGYLRSFLQIAHRFSQFSFADIHSLKPIKISPDIIQLEEYPKVYSTLKGSSVKVENKVCYHSISYNSIGYILRFSMSDNCPSFSP